MQGKTTEHQGARQAEIFIENKTCHVIKRPVILKGSPETQKEGGLLYIRLNEKAPARNAASLGL